MSRPPRSPDANAATAFAPISAGSARRLTTCTESTRSSTDRRCSSRSARPARLSLRRVLPPARASVHARFTWARKSPRTPPPLANVFWGHLATCCPVYSAAVEKCGARAANRRVHGLDFLQGDQRCQRCSGFRRQLLRAFVFFHFAVAHADDAMGARGDIGLMGDQNDCVAALVEPRKPSHDFLAGSGIQVPG